jgi:hypothetical protein
VYDDDADVDIDVDVDVDVSVDVVVDVDVDVDVVGDGDVVIEPVSNNRTTEFADSVDMGMDGVCCFTCSVAYA